jgi:hypothetical protein
MMSDFAIILQGPTTYYKEIIHCYSGLDNVVWSTWEDEPISNLNFIKSSTINLVLSKKPSNVGYMNSNLQAHSVIEGIKYFDEFSQINFFVKIRSDIIISPLSSFIMNIKCHISSKYFSGIIFIGYCSYEKSNYFLDYIVIGKKNNLINYFYTNENIDNEYGRPFPELFFQNSLISKSSCNLILNKFSLLKVDGISFFWIKYNKDLKKMSHKIHFRTIYYPIIWLNTFFIYYYAKSKVYLAKFKSNL